MCYLKKNGTYDLYGKNSLAWQHVLDKITNVCKLYNFNLVRTPIFESTDLYYNLIGKNTDVVSKELYNFTDRNNDTISLRPEGTTGVVRSYLENKLYLNNEVSKFYYYGSMFRHEKVEVGRFREFQQFGVEVFNNDDYICDVEIISLAVKIFKSLGLKDVKVYINNLGSYENKCKYERDLKEYFKDYFDDLCNDCKKRYTKNAIRILDCKKDKRKDYVLNAPKIEDYINEESKLKFNKILEALDEIGIDYVVNKNLVRGLNYYTDIVFEIKTNINGLGCANTICGGGRYNHTILTDEKKYIPAMGFAIGLERLIDIMNRKELLCNINKVIDFNIKFNDFKLCDEIRDLGFVIEFNSNDESHYIIDKDDDKYLLINNLNGSKYILDYEQLLIAIKNL